MKAVDLIQQVQEIDMARPTRKTMLEDIKMMNIRIRSRGGDLFSLKHDESRFVQSLWRISKIEQIASQASKILDEVEADTFFTYLNSTSEPPHFHDDTSPSNAHVITLEIFKQELVLTSLN